MKAHQTVPASATRSASRSERKPAPEAPAPAARTRRAAEGARTDLPMHDFSRMSIGERSTTNNTGLPGPLKAGVENLSGLAMDDVRVHFNSSRPAALHALAYTQGTDIHVGPGQERHLPHEAWHVVQQKQGRVKPTLQMKGKAINHDSALEREADAMAARAAASSLGRSAVPEEGLPKAVAAPLAPVAQRKVGFEFETGIPVATKDLIGAGYTDLRYQQPIFNATTGDWKVVADSSNMEFVTEPFDENPAGRAALINAMTALENWAGQVPAPVMAAHTNREPGTARVDTVDPAAGTTANLFLQPLVIPAVTLTDAEILASPQATGGVRLDQIPTLVDRMTTTTITAAKPQALGLHNQAIANMTVAGITQAAANGHITNAERDDLLATRAPLVAYEGAANVTPQHFSSSLVGMNVLHAHWLFDAKRRAVHEVDRHAGTLPHPRPDFEKLKGLLTLVVSYLLVGANQPQVMPYSKIIAPLMARTNFYTMYGLLDDHEKAVFTENFVLTTANMAGTGGNPIFAAGFRHKGAIEHGPTRAAWIDSIKRGSPGSLFGRNPTDLLSQGSGSTAAANSSSLGGMTEPDRRVTGQRDLAVLELRRLPKRVQRLEWHQMALDVFDMIVALP